VKPPDYQCVQIGEVWHLTQEQATLPRMFPDGAYTSCVKWANVKPGYGKSSYEKRRPTCEECLHHVAVFEKKGRGKAYDWMADVDE
jgi:hypothetical protein